MCVYVCASAYLVGINACFNRVLMWCIWQLILTFSTLNERNQRWIFFFFLLLSLSLGKKLNGCYYLLSFYFSVIFSLALFTILIICNLHAVTRVVLIQRPQNKTKMGYWASTLSTIILPRPFNRIHWYMRLYFFFHLFFFHFLFWYIS